MRIEFQIFSGSHTPGRPLISGVTSDSGPPRKTLSLGPPPPPPVVSNVASPPLPPPPHSAPTHRAYLRPNPSLRPVSSPFPPLHPSSILHRSIPSPIVPSPSSVNGGPGVTVKRKFKKYNRVKVSLAHFRHTKINTLMHPV